MYDRASWRDIVRIQSIYKKLPIDFRMREGVTELAGEILLEFKAFTKNYPLIVGCESV